jgi:AraC-like DNA-binding protein
MNMTNFRAEILMFGDSTYSQFWKVKEESVSFHRLYYVHGGSALYESGNQNVSFKKNHLYILPCYRQYKMIQDFTDPLVHLWIHALITPMVMDSFIEIDIAEPSIAYYLVKTLEAVILDPHNRIDKQVVITELVQNLFHVIDSLNKLSVMSDSRMKKVVEYIELHYKEKITIEDLSSMIGLHSKYFIRLFQKTFNMSPHHYILEYRFSKAVILLSRGMTLTDVAENVGFDSYKSFCRAFKKCIGITPTEYKKSYLYYVKPV